MSELLTGFYTKNEVILSKTEVLSDYKLACESRAVSLLGRKDVFMGRAKFGIFGDGKELAQIALSKVFRKGDFRSGYYRDQTLIAANGGLTWQQFFAQLYAHADINHDIFSGGRSMNAHYGNHWIDDQGRWLDQTDLYNDVMDVSSTAGQMPRSVGLAYASKLYRNNPYLKKFKNFSNEGNEVCFSTIGDASTSQGMFFEAVNAAGVLQIPLVMSVWDDGYGISVPIEYQTTKGSISEALAGFQKTDGNGIEIINVQGWNYPELIKAYQKAARIARDQHVPVLVHVYEVTQPQGHSASGSHERYKSKDRLEWETDFDCNKHFKKWILQNNFANEAEILKIEKAADEVAKDARKKAWDALKEFINSENKLVIDLLNEAIETNKGNSEIIKLKNQLETNTHPLKKDGIKALKKLGRLNSSDKIRKDLGKLLETLENKNTERYSSHLYSEFETSPMNVKPVSAQYSDKSPMLDGREIINKFFDYTFSKNPLVFALGEDIGKIGDVNQGFAGLQEKYGELRITDTGIRETTIIGQGIGAAMRGLRPIVEIQYFDYIYYALPSLTDDLASLRYRTVGKQAAPLIVRTRGHRLEGIWHSGSPMAVMIHALRGMHIVVPRNFVKAAGFYNTLLKGDDPALVIESLNGYRLKEKLPDNLNEICEPLGVPEIIKEGSDITIVTYGSMCRIVVEAAEELKKVGISAEVIDVQTLLPFDINKIILKSVKKTNRVIFADEDMPGGGTAYMMQQVLDEHDAYTFLDSKPIAVSAKAHRPAYGTDGDYFSKPNVETIFDAAYQIMTEVNPVKFPDLY
ncbi:transketolase [Lacihabitans sp. LS3-19]|uniref:alpha-ketoacid dehydrogenase subunit alpha/beta n=1 Tax=Lacihabitans sp. LS3-19 TaxID=2487335 RepID=UPI0020CBB1E3|nr:thiamine pyrophosphate-dependent enzyme [Lacihabitans sp. LS3-19]MCP9770736.1 transketolase [Lacihabitans sp. LS3-19]